MNSTGISKTILWLTVLANFICFIWYLQNLIQFGFGFDQVDGLGAFFLINIFVLIRFRKYHRAEFFGHFAMTVWVFINMLMLLLFLRQFLSIFDPFYRVTDQFIFYFIRGGFLITGLLTVFTLGPIQYFQVKKWVLLLAGALSMWWMFVYAAPSIVRSFLATSSVDISEITGIPGDRLLSFSGKKPERLLQQDATVLAGISWILFFTLGYRGKKRELEGQNDKKEVITINESWSLSGNPDMETTISSSGDFIIHDEERTISISIWEKGNAKMEEIFHELKDESQAERNKSILDEFEFIENDRMLFGYHFMEEEQDNGKVYHALKGFTVVDGEFVKAYFQFASMEGVNKAIAIWKEITPLKREFLHEESD